MKHLKIGYLQQHNVADVKTNMQRLADGVRDLAKRGAELVVLQELHNSLYFCQVEDVDNFDLAEPIPGPSTDFYGALARECNVVIVTSLFERRAPGLYHNTAVVMERDGSIAGKYRKMHIPDDPAYYEKFLLHTWRPRLPSDSDQRGQTRRTRMLGPVVPGGSPTDGSAGCRTAHLSYGYRLRCIRHRGRAAASARGVDNRAAGSCRC